MSVQYIFERCKAGDVNFFRDMIEQGKNLNIIDQWGNSLISMAIKWTRGDIMRMLVNAGADFTIRNKNGRSPLFHAVASRACTAAEYLLSKGANPNIIDVVGDTPLHWAVRHQDVSVIHALVRAGANPDLWVVGGVSARYLARQQGFFFAVEIFNGILFQTKENQKKRKTLKR